VRSQARTSDEIDVAELMLRSEAVTSDADASGCTLVICVRTWSSSTLLGSRHGTQHGICVPSSILLNLAARLIQAGRKVLVHESAHVLDRYLYSVIHQLHEVLLHTKAVLGKQTHSDLQDACAI